MTLTESQAFTVGSDWELVSQGAEAKLWKIPAGPLFDVPCIAKERFSKAYRHPALDEKLTKQRCRAESRILTKCVEKGIPAPRVLRTDAPVLYLEYIDAPTVREYLETDLLVTLTDDTQDSPQHNKLQQLADAFGQMVAALHNLGIVHGDLTTSNAMIRLPEMTLIAIDFGLAKNTTSMEERAVDLYVLERALSSTHPKLPTDFWTLLLKSYQAAAEKAEATLSRLEQVQIRGRKRECFG
ncbi:TP53 regulating kinase and related kinases [Fistulifera solaris]|uniref:non-specific serine/threonine protein kinase n=1 Tax=Fistulifera solaris TaxID=1519565 RepID=A0A1Z5KBA0_FISSO|nr:TP53 regulating kinase and related kinases [Fistulifera solaris]|eukprot:GAX23527.1 TP53 regulating kinase and related kinases [Fistulifera solaris]